MDNLIRRSTEPKRESDCIPCEHDAVPFLDKTSKEWVSTFPFRPAGFLNLSRARWRQVAKKIEYAQKYVTGYRALLLISVAALYSIQTVPSLTYSTLSTLWMVESIVVSIYFLTSMANFLLVRFLTSLSTSWIEMYCDLVLIFCFLVCIISRALRRRKILFFFEFFLTLVDLLLLFGCVPRLNIIIRSFRRSLPVLSQVHSIQFLISLTIAVMIFYGEVEFSKWDAKRSKWIREVRRSEENVHLKVTRCSKENRRLFEKNDLGNPLYVKQNELIFVLSPIQNVLDSLWFSFSSLMIVGYGDIIPINPISRVLTFIGIFSGIATISLSSVFFCKTLLGEFQREQPELEPHFSQNTWLEEVFYLLDTTCDEIRCHIDRKGVEFPGPMLVPSGDQASHSPKTCEKKFLDLHILSPLYEDLPAPDSEGTLDKDTNLKVHVITSTVVPTLSPEMLTQLSETLDECKSLILWNPSARQQVKKIYTKVFSGTYTTPRQTFLKEICLLSQNFTVKRGTKSEDSDMSYSEEQKKENRETTEFIDNVITDSTVFDFETSPGMIYVDDEIETFDAREEDLRRGARFTRRLLES